MHVSEYWLSRVAKQTAKSIFRLFVSSVHGFDRVTLECCEFPSIITSNNDNQCIIILIMIKKMSHTLTTATHP